MKKFAVLLIGLWAFGMVTTAYAAQAATMSLSPTEKSVQTGEVFSVSILVNPNGEEIDTARASVSYPASLLEVTSFTLGSLFPSQAPGNSIDNTNGLISQGAFKFGDPVVSSGTFGTITFRALSSGSATIAVTSDSKLISSGEEKINVSALGQSIITISGQTVEVTTPTTTSSTTSATSSTSTNPEEQALVYFGAFAGRMPSSSADWDANHCIAYDSCYPGTQNLEREQKSLTLYTEKYGDIPRDSIGWNAIHAIAYTNVFISWTDDVSLPTTSEQTTETEETASTSESSLEEQALVYFGAFYGRMPSSENDWNALHCIAYGGCQGSPQNVLAEQESLIIFGQKYAKMPETSMEWNVIHTLAYTDYLETDITSTQTTDESEKQTDTTELESTTTESSELTLEQQAIGWFGQITGYLPSSDADWLAIDYMVNGYTPEAQDLDKESQAIAKFVQVFGYLPSSSYDWNIISALAYSGAFSL